ncbi:hypothetical protein [Cupriavidus necator]
MNIPIPTTLVIDGTDEYGNYDGAATRGPWVVFDVEAQCNVAGPYPFRWMATLMRGYLVQLNTLP